MSAESSRSLPGSSPSTAPGRLSLGTIQRIEKLPAAACPFGTLQRFARALSLDMDALISQIAAGFSDPPQADPLRRPVSRPRAERWWLKAKPFPSGKAGHGRYDPATVRDLLAMTGEFPDTEGGMLILLNEYRHALCDMAAEAASGRADMP